MEVTNEYVEMWYTTGEVNLRIILATCLTVYLQTRMPTNLRHPDSGGGLDSMPSVAASSTREMA